jgi:hypothetical protein
MKANGKKLAVFVIVAAITMSIAITMASADPKVNHALKGQYAFSGPGQCVISTTGFGENYVPIPGEGAAVFAASQIWEGVYTFNRDGSGTIRAFHRSFQLPALTLETANISWDFKYKMTDKDRFQTELVEGTYDKVEWTSGLNCVEEEGKLNCATTYFDVDGTIDGVISPDGDSIIMTCGQPTKLILCVPDGPSCIRTQFEAYCSFSHQGFRVRDKLR